MGVVTGYLYDVRTGGDGGSVAQKKMQLVYFLDGHINS